jgi:hypothetical protein
MGWLTKLVIMFAVLGVLAFDGFQVMVGNFGAADDATTAARAAADSFRVDKDVQKAYDAAVLSLVEKPNDVVETETFKVRPDGGIDLVVRREPKTLWMHRIGPLKDLSAIHQSGSASPSP